MDLRAGTVSFRGDVHVHRRLRRVFIVTVIVIVFGLVSSLSLSLMGLRLMTIVVVERLVVRPYGTPEGVRQTLHFGHLGAR